MLHGLLSSGAKCVWEFAGKFWAGHMSALPEVAFRALLQLAPVESSPCLDPCHETRCDLLGK